ncbi:hypothetical protein HON52_02890 [Candidatus Uhrbacteria bacterium]|nr:hypothetical protein [Candidatus Uhrbacteria bacterium]
MRLRSILQMVLVALLSACALDGADGLPAFRAQIADTDTPSGADDDGDGFNADDDCDDSNAAVNPDATEVCDGKDNDCDGATDEDVQTNFFEDSDADGFGDDTSTQLACETPEGFSAQSGDCNDDDGDINPGAIEVCDEQDNNCDGEVDEGVTTTSYPDVDGDRYGDPDAPYESCTLEIGYVDNADDCDDTEPSVNLYAIEVCDELDNDCDGLTDAEDVDDIVLIQYPDGDGDLYGDADFDGEEIASCDGVEGGYSPYGTDCDDGNAEVHPGATEVCNTVDDDCDGYVDSLDSSWDVSSGTTYFADTDEDGYGDAAASQDSCSQPSGYGLDDSDCDDTDVEVNPGASEDCDDSRDLDCSGGASDGATDVDADSYVHDSCDGGTDCDDADSTVYPGATETWYDGVDSDCDGASDYDQDLDGEDHDSYGGTDCDDVDDEVNSSATEDCGDTRDLDCSGSALDGTTDVDGDSYIDEVCTGSSGDDCDDTDSSINPGATETWYDGVDQDCDGASDYDADSDGEDSDAYSGTDCDDTDSAVNTSATDTWYDGVDSDCDGANDYDQDLDGEDHDSYGGTDCDDDDDEVNSSATEDCGDTRDMDCSGSATDGLTDADGDGYVDETCVDSSGTDCNDEVDFVNPGEAANPYSAWDQDCDGVWDRAGETVSTDAGSFTFDSAAVNLFPDEEGDSTFEGGLSNWEPYASSSGTTSSSVVEFTYTSYPGAGDFYSIELLYPAIGQGVDNEALGSSGFSVTSGHHYAICCVIVNDGVDGQGLRIWTATEYDVLGDYMANESIAAGTENFICASWTAASTTTEYAIIATGNWTSSTAGLATHCAVGEGS